MRLWITWVRNHTKAHLINVLILLGYKDMSELNKVMILQQSSLIFNCKGYNETSYGIKVSRKNHFSHKSVNRINHKVGFRTNLIAENK